jgi:ATP-dependent DNA ligase
MITGQPTLPFITPMLATPCREPVDGSDWVFEAKHDGFRALTYVDGHCPLLSRNGYRFSGFDRLEEAFAQTLRGHTAIPDGELVCLDGKGRSLFVGRGIAGLRRKPRVGCAQHSLNTSLRLLLGGSS